MSTKRQLVFSGMLMHHNSNPIALREPDFEVQLETRRRRPTGWMSTSNATGAQDATEVLP